MLCRPLALASAAALALVLAVPAPAAAGIPPADQSAKQVTKALDSAAKSALKELNGRVKEATSELRAELKLITQAFKSGEATTEDAQDLWDALQAFQTTMTALADEADDLYGPLGIGLASLDRSDDSFTGRYPADFMPGAGGRFDNLVEELDRALAKPYPWLDKQLAKLQKLAEKKSGLLLAVRVAPVFGLHEQAVNTNASTGGGRHALTIDLTMSAHDADGERILWVAGEATDFGEDLQVLMTGQSSSTQDAIHANDRYERTFVGPNPGNYLFIVRSPGDDQSVRQSLGLR